MASVRKIAVFTDKEWTDVQRKCIDETVKSMRFIAAKLLAESGLTINAGIFSSLNSSRGHRCALEAITTAVVQATLEKNNYHLVVEQIGARSAVAGPVDFEEHIKITKQYRNDQFATQRKVALDQFLSLFEQILETRLSDSMVEALHQAIQAEELFPYHGTCSVILFKMLTMDDVDRSRHKETGCSSTLYTDVMQHLSSFLPTANKPNNV